MGSSVERRLYGSYPAPFQAQEMQNGYVMQPRQGPDNVFLAMQGWAGVESSKVLPDRKGPLPPPPPPPPQFSQQQFQLATLPPAGAPTNPHYNVFSPVAAPEAGQYRTIHGVDMQRMGKGLYADSALHDHITKGGGGLTVEKGHTPPTQGLMTAPRANDGRNGWHSNGDALENFMTGIAGAHSPKDGQAGFENVFGKQHAGKNATSHLQTSPTGMHGPTAPLDAMPHMRHYSVGAHSSSLQAHEAGGYVPLDDPNGRGSGIRMFTGAPQSQDHLQVSPTGITAGEMPFRPTPWGGKANASSLTVGAAGMSHAGNDAGYPAIRNGPFAGKGSQSQLQAGQAGLVQGGQAPARNSPFAGLSNKSQLQAGPQGFSGADPGAQWYNPHAGKSQASQITYSSGTMTILPTNGRTPRQPSTGNSHWATTYDDTYVQLNEAQRDAAQWRASQRPERF